MISVLITLTHKVVGHHHHISEIDHQDNHDGDHDDDHDHSIFSFVQLDDTFIHSNEQVQVNNSFVILCFIQPNFFSTESIPEEHPVFKDETYPPPDNPHCRHLSFRGPPFLIS